MNLSFPYRVEHIPRNTAHNRRPGTRINPVSITIHSTGNTRSTALNERGWLVNSTNRRTASWHIAVDDKMAVEAIPLNEMAYHAGSREGNSSSIGIEICESGNRERTIANAVELVVALLMERGWRPDGGRIKRHYDWSRKICPRIFYPDNWRGWTSFLTRVEREMRAPLPLPEVQRRLILYINGQRVHDFDAYLIDSTSYVPIRIITDSLGRRVIWNGEEYSIDIR